MVTTNNAFERTVNTTVASVAATDRPLNAVAGHLICGVRSNCNEHK